MSEAEPSEGCQQRALVRARRRETGRPSVLAWLAGLSIHAALVVLLVI